MRFLAWVAVSAAVCWSLVWFFGPRPAGPHGEDAARWSALFRPALPETDGIVSWKTLGAVSTVKQADRLVPRFSPAVTALDGTEVKLQGFMTPLAAGELHPRFILSAMPPSCAFCLPGGPDAIVEVQAREPVKHAYEPIVLAGRLRVLSEDPTGLYYRLTDARLVADHDGHSGADRPSGLPRRR